MSTYSSYRSTTYSGVADTTPASQVAAQRVMSVSQALTLAKNALESFTVHMVGEVSEVNAKAGYKAVYFTIKDTQSSVPCMMWLNRYQASGVTITQGAKVEVIGKFSIYAAKGRMNFDVYNIKLAGEGDLRKKVADLAKKLQNEGLTHPHNKKPLPEYPMNIGVVTSPRGAAVHDVMRTLRRRFPLATIKLAGVPVEGVHAAAGMIVALQTLAQTNCEVILLVRGGGSFEDLMPFNDEGLARAIFASPIPVVTGIGHEPDTTIADMVSDCRASTPTAAAETVAPAASEIYAHLASSAQVMSQSVNRSLEHKRFLIDQRTSRPIFKDPQSLFANDAQTLDMMYDRLIRAIPGNLARDAHKLESYALRIKQCGTNLMVPYKHAFALKTRRLNDLSPLSILERGYSMTQNSEGRVISHVSDVNVNDDVTVSLSDGILTCTVQAVTNKGDQ